jgi:hypothetical protein
MLYLIAQPSTMDLASPDALRFVSIMTVVSVVGGLTVESVFRKLLGVDVVQTAAIAVQARACPGPAATAGSSGAPAGPPSATGASPRLHRQPVDARSRDDGEYRPVLALTTR